MKHKGINFFSILILLVFAGALFYFFNTIYTDYKQGISRSEKIFKEISTLAENSPEQIKTELFTEKDGILSAKYSKNNKTLIALPDEQTSSQIINSKLVKVFYKTIVLQEDTYELKIAVYILRPDVIYSAARNSFIVILAATLFTIGMLIFVSSKDKKIADNDETENETDKQNLDEEFSIENEEEIPEQENEKIEEIDEFPEFSEESTEEIENNEKDEDIQEEIEIPTEEILSEPENEEPEEPEQADKNENNEEIPDDTYYDEHKVMQSSQISPESPYNLNERINFELTKAAADDQDFSILLIEIKDSPKFSDIEKFLTDNYGKNNIFRFRDEILALLKENTNIDEAEDKAALIENNIRTFFDEPNITIGISSRSIRTITADRLIAEAEEALNHANNEPESKIVGFHVDVEKYREFVENSKNNE